MFRKLYNRYCSRSVFVRSILILSTGTGIAQLIPIIASFVLARLYNSADFGYLSIFSSITGVLGGVATLKYDMAIILPKRQNDARNLLYFSIASSLIIGLLIFILYIIVSDEYWCHLFKTENVDYFILIPILVFGTGVFNALFNWFIRTERYKLVSLSKIFQGLSSSIFKLLFGFASCGFGLIYGTVLSNITIVIYLLYVFIDSERDVLKRTFSFYKQNKLVREYKDFFFYSTPASFANSLSMLGLPLVITSYYSVNTAGLYFFANSIVRIPVSFIVQSVSQVYKKRASGLYNTKKYKDLLILTYRIQKTFFCILFPIVLVASIWGGDLFSILFGEKWYDSGDYIRYFSIFLLFGSTYSVISSIGDVLRIQKILLIFNVLLFLSQLLSYYILHDVIQFKYVLLISSCLGASLYIGLYLIVINKLLNLEKLK